MSAVTAAIGGNTTRGATLEDRDRDALYILPLSILPLRTPGLKRARMLKDSRLNSVIELFKDEKSGSGRVELDALPIDVLRSRIIQEVESRMDLEVLSESHEVEEQDRVSLEEAIAALN